MPAGLLGTLVLVAAVETTLERRADWFRDWMGFLWRHSARAAVREGPRSGVLFLGDSLVKEGVLPALVGDRLGVPAYNLAVHGGSAPSSYYLLRRAVRAGARPRLVVVDFHPNLLAAAPRSTPTSYWAELLSPVEALELAWRAHDLSLGVKSLLAGAFPSYRLRPGLRDEVMAALVGTARPDRALCRSLARNLAVNRGTWVHRVREPGKDSAAVLRHLPDLGAWRPYPANVWYLRRLVDLAERSGARVVWLWPPTTPEWQARRVAIGGDRAYEALIRSVQADHPGLVVVDGRHSGYDHSAFYEMTHMHALGAAAQSAGLSEVLAPYLASAPGAFGSSAWVALPPYPRNPALPAVEDEPQSRLAVGAPAATLAR